METLRKEFSIKSFSFPLESKGNFSYQKVLSRNLNLFEDKISKITSKGIGEKIKNELETVKILNKEIYQTITDYLSGNSGKSYITLEKLLEKKIIKDKIVSLINKDKLSQQKEYKLFRLRISESKITNREQMFHVPFSKRYLVANQRFSISGLPCLYFGSSIYVSWLELDSKDFNKMWISGIEPKGDYNVLNLAFDLNILFDQFDKKAINEEQFINCFLLWPLVMASSFRTKHPNSNFHEEYIIPSLLLQWITFKNNNIEGIKYLSTKLENYKTPKRGINYVFPPKNTEEDYDFCSKLQGQFHLTNPIPWSLLSTLPDSNVVISGALSFDNIEEAIFDGYDVSAFYYAEEKILRLNKGIVKNPKKN